jgi:hypothetical protein
MLAGVTHQSLASSYSSKLEAHFKDMSPCQISLALLPYSRGGVLHSQIDGVALLAEGGISELTSDNRRIVVFI